MATSKFQSSLGFCSTASGKVKKQDYSILTLREQELHDQIDMIIMKNWPLNWVANPHYRSFGRGESNFGIDTVGVNPPKWITNQMCDRASVNILLSKILGIPHINFENHLLNNKVSCG